MALVDQSGWPVIDVWSAFGYNKFALLNSAQLKVMHIHFAFCVDMIVNKFNFPMHNIPLLPPKLTLTHTPSTICRPLHLSAALANIPEITYLLLDHGANIDARNSNQSTPLFAACKANNPDIASKLIEKGYTFLFTLLMLMILIESDVGADYRAQDLSGNCAFDNIQDHKEWIDSGHFDEEISAMLKGKL